MHVGVERVVSTSTNFSPNNVGVLSAVSAQSANDSFDFEALDRKNAYRKKYGLKPLTPEQFLENEVQVQQLSQNQELKAAELQQQKAAASAAKMTQQQNKEKNFVPGFLEKILGVAQDTCESNYDCESPQVCCDFGFTRKCCSSGMRQRSREGELILVPVPVDIQGPPSYY